MFIYDLEIKNAIPPKDVQQRKDGIKYCAGWEDYANMGISCIGVWDYKADKPRVFGERELQDFQAFVNSHDVAIGYNSLRFDNNVLEANNVVIQPHKTYDLLQEIYAALGSRQKGCRLDDVVKANFPNLAGKTGNGADAPAQWQTGQHTKVIDYCLNDVRLTKMIMDKILRSGEINNPIFPDQKLKMRRP